MARKSGNLAGRLALGAGAAMLAAAAPSAVLATGFFSKDGASGVFATFTPASADPRMARFVAQNRSAETRMMRFTPAGASASRNDRSVTVAVRIDQEVAQVIAGRSGNDRAARDVPASGGLRIAASRYDLGVARGYNSFAEQAAGRPALSSTLSDAGIPDLSEFEPSPGVRSDPSRFAARIALDEGRPTVRAGEAVSRTTDQMLDVGGSYRLTPNLNVRAGVRYEQDRDLSPLPSIDHLDSQAVYVGTQFRF